MRVLPEGGVDPLIVGNITLGLAELGKVIDLGNEIVHLSIDRSIPTATTEPAPDGLTMRVNDLYYYEVTSLGPTQEPGKDAPEYMGEHEGLHRWISPENPAFAALTVWQRDGDGFAYSFHGATAMAVYGGPVPIDEYGHILGPKGLGDVMSGSWPTFRDRPQQPSALDLAMAKDGGATLIQHQAPSLLAELYAADFGRAPDAAGLAYWQHQLDAGMPIAAIAQSFFAQPEAQAAFANGHIVEAVFERAFGRAPDPDGLAYWNNALESGAVSRGQFVLAVVGGAQGADAQHLVEIVGMAP